MARTSILEQSYVCTEFGYTDTHHTETFYCCWWAQVCHIGCSRCFLPWKRQWHRRHSEHCSAADRQTIIRKSKHQPKPCLLWTSTTNHAKILRFNSRSSNGAYPETEAAPKSFDSTLDQAMELLESFYQINKQWREEAEDGHYRTGWRKCNLPHLQEQPQPSNNNNALHH
jgi:hypothetical protein